MTDLHISLLGPFEVKLDGEVIQHFDSTKVRALLAYLAAEAGRPQARSTLAGLLWPGYPDASAHKSLRQALYSLRKTLNDPPCIESDRQSITLVTGEDCRVDVLELVQALNETRTNPNAIPRLSSAIELYHGPFLEGFTLADSPEFEAWVLSRREHHSRHVLEALSLLVDWHEGQGQLEQVERYARQQLEIEPWREEAHRQLMRSLTRQGKRVEALAEYERLQELLKDEMGIEPSAETAQLYEAVRAGKLGPQGDSRTLIGTPPKRSRHNLPGQLTPFMGRSKPIRQVKELLNQHRLVTIVGPGGVGKTRLAIRVTEECFEQYEQGAYFIDLAAIRDPELVIPAVISSLELHTEGTQTIEQALLGFLTERQVLLVMDNCEHVIQACATLIGKILHQCPRVKVLATSREILGVEGEIIYQLQPMDLPGVESEFSFSGLQEAEAIQFFSARARTVLPGFEIGENNAGKVIEICQRLDGIPLALELAAARLRVLSIEQIALMLADRFQLLSRGRRESPSRQQTLQASIEWSYNLLEKKERILFRRLSVFAGGCNLESAQRVCADEDLEAGAVLDLIDQLAGKSLLVVQHGETPRYRMLETIREYAHQKLVEAGEFETFRDRHLDYMLQLAVEFDRDSRNKEKLVAFHFRLDPEIANLRLALSWAAQSEVHSRIEKAAGILPNLAIYWHSRDMMLEAINWCQTFLNMLPRDDPECAETRARICLYLGGDLGYFLQSGHLEYLQESADTFEKLDNPLMLAKVQLRLVYWSLFKGKDSYPETSDLAWQVIETVRKSGDQRLIAETLISLSRVLSRTDGKEVGSSIFEEGYKVGLETQNLVAYSMGRYYRTNQAFENGDYQTVQKHFEENLEMDIFLNIRHGIAEMKGCLSGVAYFFEDFRKMEALSREAIEQWGEIGMRHLSTNELRNLGIALSRQGKYAESRAIFLDALTLIPESYFAHKALVLAFIGGIHLETGQPQRAARLLGFADSQIKDHLDILFSEWFIAEYQRINNQIKERIHEAEIAAAWSDGEKLTLEQALAIAQEPAGELV